MKKTFIFILLLALTLFACAQQVSKTNITIQKAAPTLFLNGTNAAINFYNSDVVLQQSSNLLTLSGGDFSLGSNNLLTSGSLGTTGSRILKGWMTNLEITNLPTINGGTLASALSLSSYLLKTDTAAMLTNYITRGDTASMLNNYALISEVGENINDSLDLYLAAADVGLSLADSTGNAQGNYVTRKALNDSIVSKITPSLAVSSFLTELQAIGLDAKLLPIGAGQPMSTNKTLIDGTANWQAFYLPSATVITGVKWLHRTGGSYTADEYNGIGLYSVSGTNYTKVAETTNNGDIWKSSGYALETAAFSTPYSAVPGMYYVAFVWNASATSTAPSIYCWNGSVGISQLLTGTNAHRISGTVNTQTTLPATETAGDLTATDVIYGIWLY